MKASIDYPAEPIIDSKLQHFLRVKLNNSPYHYLLRSLANCGKHSSQEFGVHILSNGTETKTFGIQFCNNSWLCPECTARQMAKYAGKISSAIDALSHQNLVPFMLTFTMFHTETLRIDDCFKILCEAYTCMIKKANWKRKRIVKGKVQKNNVQGEYYTSGGTWNNFISTFNIRHIIKSLEVTYGIHGWHPHYHNIYFVEKSRLQEVKAWIDNITEYWNKHLDKYYKKYITADRYPASHDVFFRLKDKYFSRVALGEISHTGCTLSLNPDGTVHQIASGNYISGWGGDNELAGNPALKTANDGHYTPLQLLAKAYESNDDHYFKLYCEIAYELNRCRRHRIDFSRTGINKIIAEWQKTEEYQEQYKKKLRKVADAKKIRPFKTVCWFQSHTWSEIFWTSTKYNIDLITLIKIFATYNEAYDLICDLCEVWNLAPPLKNHPAYDIAPDFNAKLQITAA